MSTNSLFIPLRRKLYLMQVDCDDLLHAVLDHLGGEEVGLALPLDRNLSKQNRNPSTE